ncbi:hypothetical protein ANCDUO_22048, partial [Ancylostoma duodenale]
VHYEFGVRTDKSHTEDVCRDFIEDQKQHMFSAIESSKEYVEKIAKNRTKLIPRDIDMSCEGLRRRILPPKKLRPLKPFSVAFARVVYESYEFIEDELRSSYHPQNFFCYSVDSKASDEFNSRIEALQKCFPNVFVTE